MKDFSLIELVNLKFACLFAIDYMKLNNPELNESGKLQIENWNKLTLKLEGLIVKCVKEM